MSRSVQEPANHGSGYAESLISVFTNQWFVMVTPTVTTKRMKTLSRIFHVHLRTHVRNLSSGVKLPKNVFPCDINVTGISIVETEVMKLIAKLTIIATTAISTQVYVPGHQLVSYSGRFRMARRRQT